jgi:hypothetical protein
MSRFAGALLGVALLGTSAWADVIPSRRSDETAAQAKRQVADRLQELGVGADRAVAHADGLSDREARFFAEDPNRVQVAGDEQLSGFPVWAFTEGLILLGGCVATGLWMWNVRG